MLAHWCDQPTKFVNRDHLHLIISPPSHLMRLWNERQPPRVLILSHQESRVPWPSLRGPICGAGGKENIGTTPVGFRPYPT